MPGDDLKGRPGSSHHAKFPIRRPPPPPSPIPDRVSITAPLPPNQRTTYAQFDGPGCIQHIWVVLAQPERLPLASR